MRDPTDAYDACAETWHKYRQALDKWRSQNRPACFGLPIPVEDVVDAVHGDLAFDIADGVFEEGYDRRPDLTLSRTCDAVVKHACASNTCKRQGMTYRGF
jgi:hypothetical protein